MSEIQAEPSRWSSQRWLVAIFLIFALAIGATGYFYYAQRREVARQRAQAILATIAESKAREIVAWRRERLYDAAAITGNPLACEAAADVIEGTEDPATREKVRQWLASLQVYAGNRGLSLVDGAGGIRFSVGEPGHGLDVTARQALKEALASGKPALMDLHAVHEVAYIHMDLLVPVRGERGTMAGAVLIRIDPAASLYPILAGWPVPTGTGEALLVRHEGKDVLFLNPLRFERGAALRLRRPENTPGLPASLVISGQAGGVEGRDYADREVLAFVRAIPDSPWYIVAKADRSELMAALRRDARGIVLTALFLILATGGVMATFWRQHQVSVLRAEMTAVRERHALVRHFEHLVKYANDMILLADAGGRYIEVNDAALRAYGYTREEMLALSIADTRAPETRQDAAASIQGLVDAGESGMVFETLHQRKDGGVFPVEVGARSIEIEGTRYYQSIVRDITERKRAEAALRESEDRLHRALSEAPFPIMVHAEDGQVLLTSRTWNDIAGYPPEGLSTTAEWTVRAYGIEQHLVMEDIERLYGMTERKHEGEYTIHTATGDERIWDFSSAPLGTLSDGRRAVISMAMDVTDRKRAEESARESHEILLEAQALAQLGYWKWDVATGNVEWSEEVFKIFHLDPKEFTPHIDSILAFSPWPEDHERDNELIRRAMESHEKGMYEQRFLRPDQSIGHYQSTFQGQYDSEGNLVSIFGTILDTTERKRAEQVIRETKEHLEKLITHANAPIIVWDADGNITRFNRAFESISGLRADQVLGGGLEVLFPPDQRTRSMAIVARAQAGERFELVEVPILHTSGVRTVVLWNSAPIYGPDGQTQVATIAQGQDITELKQAEEARLEAERRFRSTIESVQLLAVWLDAAGRVTFCNDFLLQLAGWRSEEVIGRDWFELFLPPQERDGVRRVYLETISTGSFSPAFENAIQTRAGDLRSVLWSNTILRGPGGEVIGTSSIGQDITERKRAEMALRESERKFRETIVTLDEGYYSVTMDGKLLEHNQAFCQILGFDRDLDLKGKHIPDFWQNIEDRGAYVQELTAKGWIKGYLVNAKRTDGKKISVILNAHLTKDEKNQIQHIEGTVLDISERIRAEEKLKAQLDELQRWHEATLGREGRIQELKREINRLLVAAGQPPRFASVSGETRERGAGS